MKIFFPLEALLFFVIIFFAFLTLLAKSAPYFASDVLVTGLVQQVNFPVFVSWMQFVTWIGNLAPSSLILGFVFTVLTLMSLRKEAVFLAVSSIGAHAISFTFKVLVGRPRPDPAMVQQFGSFSTLDSFPSGHVLFFTGFFGFLLFLTFVLVKRNSLRAAVIFFLALLIASVGLSRIYLGAHWFSDVIGAYLVGSIWLLLIIKLYRKF